MTNYTRDGSGDSFMQVLPHCGGLLQIRRSTWETNGPPTLDPLREPHTPSAMTRPLSQPLDREVARAYGTSRGSELTPAQFLLTNGAYEKARALRTWVLARRLEGYTVEMINPKGGMEDCNE